jgi:hypothetical protein
VPLHAHEDLVRIPALIAGDRIKPAWSAKAPNFAEIPAATLDGSKNNPAAARTEIDGETGGLVSSYAIRGNH